MRKASFLNDQSRLVFEIFLVWFMKQPKNNFLDLNHHDRSVGALFYVSKQVDNHLSQCTKNDFTNYPHIEFYNIHHFYALDNLLSTRTQRFDDDENVAYIYRENFFLAFTHYHWTVNLTAYYLPDLSFSETTIIQINSSREILWKYFFDKPDFLVRQWIFVDDFMFKVFKVNRPSASICDVWQKSNKNPYF